MPTTDSGLLVAEVMESFMFLLHSQHRAVAKLVAENTIGELRGFTGTFTIPPEPDDDIRNHPELTGGALDFGVYPLRAALHYLGPDLTVVGAVLRREHDRGVLISGDVLLCDANGITAQIRFGMDHAHHTRCVMTGSTGLITLDRPFTLPSTHQPVVRVKRQDRREELTLPADDHFVGIVDYFTRVVRDRTNISSWTSTSLRQAALVDEVLASARVVEHPIHR